MARKNLMIDECEIINWRRALSGDAIDLLVIRERRNDGTALFHFFRNGEVVGEDADRQGGREQKPIDIKPSTV